MDKKYKTRRGKAVPWIKTRFAKDYLFEQAFKGAMAAAAISHSVHQLQLIRATNGNKTQKALALVDTTLNGIDSVNQIFREVKLTTVRPSKG